MAVDATFSPEALSIVKAAFDEACDSLPPELSTPQHRLKMAERVLKLAASGERDPSKLRACALIDIVSSTLMDGA